MQINSKIIFLNQPKLSEHEVDAKFNERRLALLPHVENFISNHERFKGKDVSVEFAQKGISSLVCIIKTSDEKLILKIPLSLSHASGESLFLKVWEKAGVKVPHIEEEGTINGHSYALMEYIDAPILSEKFSKEELIEKKLYFEMGQILRAMHEPTSTGFGLVVDGKAEYEKFEDWLNGPDMQKRFQYIRENKLLDSEHDLIETVCNILIKFVGDNTSSHFCHFDFQFQNAFATDPITIFDPSPYFNITFMDFGRSLQYFIDNETAFNQFVEGYLKGEVCDKKILYASIFLNIYFKLPYSYKTKNIDKIAKRMNFIKENKHFLEEN